MSHVIVCITAHGYGHAAQLAPVVNVLRARLPQLSVTLRTRLPRDFLAGRFAGDFKLVETAHDFGMEMSSAIDVLPEASAARYAGLHADWEAQVCAETREIEALNPDLVLSGVGYLPLAAAARVGVPAAALSSLSWRDIFDHYCAAIPAAQAVLAQIEAAYVGAPFIQVEPALPMAWHPQRYAVGPVARLGLPRRQELLRLLQAEEATRLVLVSLGGMAMRLPMERWPPVPGVRWIVPTSWGVRRADAVDLEDLDLPFTDVLHSCDALVTKPGYGAFVEAACNGLPVLYVERPDWPESPYLAEWLHAHTRAAAVTRHALLNGEIGATLAALWAQPSPPVPTPTGAAQAADLIARWLAA